MELKLGRMIDYTITPKHIWGTREEVLSLYQDEFKPRGFNMYNIEDLFSFGVVLKDVPQYGFLKARSLESKGTFYLITQQEKSINYRSVVSINELHETKYWNKEIIEIEEAIVNGHVVLEDDMAGLAPAVGIDEKPLLAAPNTNVMDWFSVKLDPNKVYYGLELEMMWGLKEDLLKKKLKQVEKTKTALPIEDPSVDAELVTVPMEIDSLKKWLDENRDLISNIGICDGVGAHIHISKVAFYSQFSMALFSVLIHESASKMKWLFGEEYSYSAKVEKKTITDWHNVDREEAVNFLNKDTVEVRAFRATQDKELIKSRLNFLSFLIEYCNSFSSPDFQDFLDWLYSKSNV